MWQTIEYKSAAIEQFRQRRFASARHWWRGFLKPQNAAEMKAAASGNPLFSCMRCSWPAICASWKPLFTAPEGATQAARQAQMVEVHLMNGFAKAEKIYAGNIKLRDENTRHVTDKGSGKKKSRWSCALARMCSMSRTTRKWKPSSWWHKGSYQKLIRKISIWHISRFWCFRGALSRYLRQWRFPRLAL